jgi:hypothetical protein
MLIRSLPSRREENLTGMDEEKDEGGRMKDEAKAVCLLHFILHPSSFRLAFQPVHPC